MNTNNSFKKDTLSDISNVLLYVFFFTLILSNTLAQGIAGVLTIILLFRLIITRGGCYKYTPLDIPFAIFIIVRFISTFMYYDLLTAIEIAGKRVLLYSVFFVITNTIEHSEIYRMTIRYVMLMIFSCVLGGFHAFYETVIEGVDRPGSFAGGYSRLAEFSSITLILSSFLRHNKKVFANNNIFLPVFFILLAILIITQSRAAWAGTFIAFLILTLKGDKWIIPLVLIVFGLAFAGIPSVRERALTLLNPVQHTSGRDIIWQEAVNKFFEKPVFGHGVKSMKLIASSDIQQYNTWHSDYLQIILESGIVGIVAYLSLSILIFLQCVNLLRNLSGEERDLIYGITACFVTMYFISFFGGHIVEPVLSLLFFSLIGITSAYSVKVRN
jgi:O-antigen ligase